MSPTCIPSQGLCQVIPPRCQALTMSTTRAMVTTPPPDTRAWRLTSPRPLATCHQDITATRRPSDRLLLDITTGSESETETGHLSGSGREGDTVTRGTTERGGGTGGGETGAGRGTERRDTGGGDPQESGRGDTGRRGRGMNTDGGTERGREAGRSRGQLRHLGLLPLSPTPMTARRRLEARSLGRRTGAGGASPGLTGGSEMASPRHQEDLRSRM